MTSTSSARTCSTHRPAGARHDRTGRSREPALEAIVASFDTALASPLATDLIGQVSRTLSPLEPAARLTAETMRHLGDIRAVIEALLATDTPGSTAALHLIVPMTCDREIWRRSQNELATRSTPVPTWVERFGEMRAATPARLVIDPVRDTETLVIGAHLAGIDLADVHASLACLGLDLAGRDEQTDADLSLPPLPALDAFTLVVTLDVSTARRVPLEVLLVLHRHDSIAARLCAMDGPASSIREITGHDAREIAEHVLEAADPAMPLDDDSTAVLPLLRCLSERLGA